MSSAEKKELRRGNAVLARRVEELEQRLSDANREIRNLTLERDAFKGAVAHLDKERQAHALEGEER